MSTFESRDEVRRFVIHNLGIWRSIHGALAVVEEHHCDFDPRVEYWWLPERRLLVSYFADRFAEMYAPVDVMRQLALTTFVHFDRAREDGRLGKPVPADVQRAQLAALCARVEAAAHGLIEPPQVEEMRRTWRRLRMTSLREDLVEYIRSTASSEGPGAFEGSFVKRLVWFPYLGARTFSDVHRRQVFFAAYYTLLASTNAYRVGGAFSFAPVLQNNPTATVLGPVLRWAQGESPDETRFVVDGRSERTDRSHHAPVVELYGFLNLARQPFYNNAAGAYASFTETHGILPGMAQIGR